jgi:acyl-CoA thioesterase I
MHRTSYRPHKPENTDLEKLKMRIISTNMPGPKHFAMALTGILLSVWALFAQGVAAKKFKILILGDSLTEGYGVEKEDAFPARLEAKLKQWQDGYQVLNGGSSGSTSASGVRRLKWYGKSEPDLVILALGSNDGLRGVKPEETRKNVETAILYCRERKWPVMLAGLKVPPNYGADYAAAFEKIYPDLAAKYKAPILGFLLEGVAGEPSLNQADGLHPNERGHELVADNLLHFLKPLLTARR